MYSPITIANYFIYKSINEGFEITPMKVLKMVYIAHGWSLGIRDKLLITEKVQAWKYGPVIVSLYDRFKVFGSEAIDGISFKEENHKKEFNDMLSNSDDKELLEKTWEQYKGYSGGQLSSLTHKEKTPWDITWNKNGGSLTKGAVISNNLIKEYYKEKAVSNSNRNNFE